MARFWLLAFNTFEEALRRKVIYILVFVALLLAIHAMYQLVYWSMAESAGETEMLATMQAQFLLSLFGMMEFWGILLAVFLGSVALFSEVKNRTIVPVLSRPVGRVSFFFAKWAGTMGFLSVFVGAGIALGLAMAIYWKIYPTPVFALGVAEIFLQVAILSAVSLAFSTVFHPVAAGGASLVLVYLHDLTYQLSYHPNVALKLVGVAGRYLAPAQSPESLLESGLLKGLIDPDYGLYFSILGENAGYALAAVLAGALVLRRRELVIR